MLYEQNLEELIFNRHEMIESDELIVLSGYLGPRPVGRLQELPFNSTVIYGMYGDKGIQSRLHNSLLQHQHDIENINIFYSNIPIHSKCYIWKYKNEVKHALIGSANFSINGLTTPYREVLAETTRDTFKPLNDYINRIMEHSTLCTDIILPSNKIILNTTSFSPQICKVSLLDNKGNIQNASGLNWGYEKNGQKSKKRKADDACLVIRQEHLENYPNLFPPIQDYSPIIIKGARSQRKNDKVEIIWDDKTIMDGLLEGSQKRNTIKYPKNFSSSPQKDIIGKYIKKRLGVAFGEKVKKEDLEKYGRTDIDISLLDEGIYYFDFSV